MSSCHLEAAAASSTAGPTSSIQNPACFSSILKHTTGLSVTTMFTAVGGVPVLFHTETKWNKSEQQFIKKTRFYDLEGVYYHSKGDLILLSDDRLPGRCRSRF
jgi:hypothetical protein